MANHFWLKCVDSHRSNVLQFPLSPRRTAVTFVVPFLFVPRALHRVPTQFNFTISSVMHLEFVVQFLFFALWFAFVVSRLQNRIIHQQLSPGSPQTNSPGPCCVVLMCLEMLVSATDSLRHIPASTSDSFANIFPVDTHSRPLPESGRGCGWPKATTDTGTNPCMRSTYFQN